MKPYLIIGIILISTILVSCGGNETPVTKFNPYKGSDGIVMELLQNAPPDEVYEEDTFNVVVKLQNKGAFHVNGSDALFFRIMFDNFYFQMYGDSQSDYSTNLTGKHPFDHYGEFKIKEFLLQSKKIEGQRESPSSQILFNLCFPYETLLTEDVCLDRDPFDLDVREKPCTSRTITLSNQGAPIAITKVDPRMPTRVKNAGTTNEFVEVAPTFAVTLKNVGGGNVIQKTTADVEDQCIVKDTNQKYWGKVVVNARLGNKPLECIPKEVALYNGEGVTNCRLVQSETVDKDGFMQLSPVSQPDILMVNASYIYVTSESHEIKIIRQMVLQ